MHHDWRVTPLTAGRESPWTAMKTQLRALPWPHPQKKTFFFFLRRQHICCNQRSWVRFRTKEVSWLPRLQCKNWQRWASWDSWSLSLLYGLWIVMCCKCPIRNDDLHALYFWFDTCLRLYRFLTNKSSSGKPILSLFNCWRQSRIFFLENLMVLWPNWFEVLFNTGERNDSYTTQPVICPDVCTYNIYKYKFTHHQTPNTEEGQMQGKLHK